MEPDEEMLAASAMPAFVFDPRRRSDPDQWPDDWVDPPGKSYLGTGVSAVVPLDRSPRVDADLGRVLDARVSSRETCEGSIAAGELEAVLSAVVAGPRRRRRPYPSAGALYPIEVYLVVARARSLETGIYHLDVGQHMLVRLTTGPEQDRVLAIFGHEWVASARAFVVLTADLERSARKYGQRALRFALLEAGALSQTLMLLSAERGLPTTMVGGFHDAGLTRLLGLRGADEPPLACVVFP